MTPIRDLYDSLPEPRGIELRRANKERLAALDADSAERAERLARVVGTTPVPHGSSPTTLLPIRKV